MPDRDMERRDALVEQGWQQMSEILDREMPQSRPRRRLLIWIPIAVIGLLAISYGTWASGILGSDKLKDNQPVQTEQNEAQAVHDDILTDRVQDESANEKKIAVEQASAYSDQQPFAQAESVKNKVGSSDMGKHPTPEMNTEVVSLNNQVYNEIDASDSGERLDLEREEETEVVGVAGVNATGFTSLVDAKKTAVLPVGAERPMIPVNHAESLVPSGLLGEMENVTSISPSTYMFDKTFGMDAYVASHWESPVTLQGIEAGLLVSLNFARRWSVTSGLAYGHHRKLGIADLTPGKSNDQELALNPNDPDTTTFTGGTTVDLSRVSYDTAQTLINKLNYLHIPLHVEFRATRGLALRAGVRASYMVGAPISQMGRVFVARPQFPNNVLADANSSPRYLLKEGVVRRWDVAPMVGIGWDITRLLAIDVQYQHGLIPYIDREAAERTDFNRTLSVGLRMKIL